jgi:hypothetical protein
MEDKVHVLWAFLPTLMTVSLPFKELWESTFRKSAPVRENTAEDSGLSNSFSNEGSVFHLIGEFVSA